MELGKILEFRRDLYFEGAVQADWFYSQEKAAKVAENFVFHGKQYFGVEDQGAGKKRIDTISLVEELTEKMSDDHANALTLAIADYGTGKSHLAVTLGQIFSGKDYMPETYNKILSNISSIDAEAAEHIKSLTDARYEFHDLNGTVDPQHQFPVSIGSVGDCLDNQAVKWVRSLNSENGNTTVKEARELTNISKKAQNRIMTGDKSLVLPLISYYGTGRLYAQKKEKKNIKSLKEFKRQVGYVDCMAAESNEKLMLNWFQIQTLKCLQEQQRTGVIEKSLLLKTVEIAICKCFERISGAKNASVIFDLDTHRLVLNFESTDGSLQKFAMDEMSDG